MAVETQRLFVAFKMNYLLTVDHLGLVQRHGRQGHSASGAGVRSDRSLRSAEM